MGGLRGARGAAPRTLWSTPNLQGRRNAALAHV